MGMTNRRNFLTAVAAGSALSWQAAQSAERPPVSNPRATSGDQIHEPDWEVRFTVTVGQGRGDLQGSDQRVIRPRSIMSRVWEVVPSRSCQAGTAFVTRCIWHLASVSSAVAPRPCS